MWLLNGSPPAGHRLWEEWLERGSATLVVALPSSRSISIERRKIGPVAKVVIGVDPHKRINAVVVLNSRCERFLVGLSSVNRTRRGSGNFGVFSRAVAAPNLGD